ncbi:MAG: WD repeat-containing protein 61 [Flavobacteriales bacterium]|jgi:WD repeat-containing protein 61
MKAIKHIEALKIAQFDGHTGAIYTLERAAEPHLFYSCSDDNMVVQWNLQNHEDNHAVVRIPTKAFALKFLPDKNLLLVGNYTGGIHIIDLNEKKEIKLLQVHKQIIFDIQYLPSKECFLAASQDGSFSVWSAKDFSLIKVNQLSNLKLRCIELYVERNEAAIGCEDGTVRIIELDTFNEIKTLKGHDEGFSVNAAIYHPNGNTLITGSRDAHLNIWDVKNEYKLLDRIPAHNYSIYSIAFIDNGRLFATGSRDKTIKIWDSESTELLLRIDRKLEGHKNSVNKILWSSYNDILLSTGDDRTIKAWNILEV